MDPVLGGTSTWEPSFEEIFELSLDLLCIAGFDGYFRRVNPTFQQSFGYSSQELLSRPFLDFVHPDDRARSRGAFEQLKRGIEVIRFENRNLRADGSTLWLEWSSRPVSGETVFYGAARDVTDRKRAEDRLRQAQEVVEAGRDELGQLAEEQTALRRVATLVARGVSSPDVLDAVAAEVTRLLDADWAGVHRYEPDGAITVLASHGEFASSNPVGTRVMFQGEGVTGSVMRTGRSARMESYDDAAGPGAARARELGIRSTVGAPITVEGRLWGVVVAAWTRQELLPADDVEVRIANFAELVGTAIANAESRAQLTASRARVVAATTEERQRVVRDLHDGAQQRLVHAVINLKLALRELGHGDEHAQTLVREALGHAEQANSELRELAHGIMPGVLTSGGLRAGVEALVSRSSLPVTMDVSTQRLPPAIEATAYFVVSEALTNAIKHSGAERAEVRAQVQEGILQVEVRDEGVGGADRGKGSGLTGLGDRVEALGGTIEIMSPAGSGTSLLVKIPFESA